jgi:hypothetical protein
MNNHHSHVLAVCSLLAGVTALSLTSGCVGSTEPPPEEHLGEVSQGLTVGCYDSPGTSGDLGIDDLYYSGPIDTIGNVTFYQQPRNGTCSGDFYTNDNALVSAASLVQATTKCLSLSIVFLTLDASSLWNGLTGHYLCYWPVAD